MRLHSAGKRLAQPNNLLEQRQAGNVVASRLGHVGAVRDLVARYQQACASAHRDVAIGTQLGPGATQTAAMVVRRVDQVADEVQFAGRLAALDLTATLVIGVVEQQQVVLSADEDRPVYVIFKQLHQHFLTFLSPLRCTLDPVYTTVVEPLRPVLDIVNSLRSSSGGLASSLGRGVICTFHRVGCGLRFTLRE